MSASIAALAAPAAAIAQAAPPVPPAPAPQDDTAAANKDATSATAAQNSNAIVVTGIRQSLRQSREIKRNAIGVVDAISAEEMGKFPDTNLAESLQRITGVSIDRSNGEGSKVTVRGFGPDFNLVLLNGRQMPASSFGDCCSAPASRSFDFANLASEGIAAVEVYKSGRATLPTGGIGATINILTPRPLDRPGLRGSVSAKAVMDHTFNGHKIAPEVSGIISDTFADNRIGILVSGAYQRRKASLAQYTGGWREGYLGSESNWGSLAFPGDPRYANIENRPGPNDVYQVPQNGGYDFTTIDRKRINGQAVLQARPVDNLTATLDYTYSQNTIHAVTNSIGVWFNHNDTSSAWTDGPAAGPLFYSEHFRAAGTNGPDDPGELKDLAITGAIAANRSINRSLGGNLAWHGLGGLRFELDAHHSTAETKPTTPYGSNIAVGSAIYGVDRQTIDFSHDMPVISVSMYPGSEIAASNIRPAGNAFRNAYMRDRINEVSAKAGYDFDSSFIKSIDFGATYTDNAVHSAYGFIQNDTWGGTLSAADTPDDLFHITPLPPALAGMSGSNDPALLANYFQVDTQGEISLLEDKLGICSHPASGTAKPGTCLAKYTVDRHIREKTFAPYIQSLHTFNFFNNPSHLRLGLRYERTKITSSALVPVPNSTTWRIGGNEVSIGYGGDTTVQTVRGEYHNWLPAIDFDVSPTRNFKLRASYSHTITRPAYDQLQGGLTVNSPARPDGGSTGQLGNPNLLPYKSKNIDLSAEYYYGPSSYISVGYFHKTVSNFIGTTATQEPLYGLTNPAQGVAYNAALAALGANATAAQIGAYIQAHYPQLYTTVGTDPAILGAPNDPSLVFTVGSPINSNQIAHLSGWELGLQHSFWNSGFGAILNYTKVHSDTRYNNALRYTVTQFAVTGVSDSANAVVYYDKNGIQARLAYNWRGGFLAGYAPYDPQYVDAYGQFDASASYEFRKGVTVFAEGINITNSDRRGHERNSHSVTFAAPGYARYSLGVRLGF
ncbi:TonB-dependent receptor [Sphingomonas sp.]|uniref:TonB-dependent receptor n=1 Tax=Sphingomonas sp. TaxID=28214 RepID=UPI0025E7C81A|nr:TonB-dependent receptor [Sphingomonas sp.]MBV9528506.1 TonB-dependent receptor [Sphingomonas sp.]